MLKFGNFYVAQKVKHLVKVEIFSHLCPNIFGHSGKCQHSENFRHLGIFMVLDNFGFIIKVEFFCCCRPFWVLSHMKENMLARTTLEVLANMTGYFNPLKSRGQTIAP